MKTSLWLVLGLVLAAGAVAGGSTTHNPGALTDAEVKLGNAAAGLL